MRKIILGGDGAEISAAGLGCMGMSGGYGPADDAESIATIHAAMDSGVTLIDTGDFYGSGHNEILIGEALKGGRRERAFLSVKFGNLRGPDGAMFGYDLRPNAIKNFIAYSLRRLRTDYIDLYQASRVDAAYPLEDVIGTLADLVKAGYVRHVGLSEASAKSLRKAHAIHPVAALQIEYSLLSRGIEKDILPAARELKIPVVAYGVLSRGLISNNSIKRGAGPGEIRGRMPRFSADNFPRNRALVEALAAIAGERKLSVAQLAFAWVCSRGGDIVPLIGARRRDQLAEALAGTSVELSSQDMARIDAAAPEGAVAGERYGAALMKYLDSEMTN